MINKLAKSLFGHCHKQLGFKNPPRLFLKKDQENAGSAFGKTAYYNPGESSITVYITNRHTKDILRSLAHELIHHHQNERGDLENCGSAEPGYAQNNKNLRKMEEEAYLQGNMLFRDWEDSCKAKFQMEESTMNMQLKDLKKMIQKSILEALNKEEETVTEDWGGGGASKIGSSSGASRDKTYAGAHDHDSNKHVQSSGHLTTQNRDKTYAAIEKACEREVGAMGGLDYRECIKKKMNLSISEESEDVDAESGFIGENEEVIDEMGGAAYKRDDDKEKGLKEADDDEPLEESEELNEAGMYRDAHLECISYRYRVGSEEYGRCMVDKGFSVNTGEKLGDLYGSSSAGAGPPGDKYQSRSDRPSDYTNRRHYSNFDESKVMTPEKEAALKENYMGAKRANLFERLSKKWAK
jgi:hypothetical protein